LLDGGYFFGAGLHIKKDFEAGAVIHESDCDRRSRNTRLRREGST
jgi:hypothetical protein